MNTLTLLRTRLGRDRVREIPIRNRNCNPRVSRLSRHHVHYSFSDGILGEGMGRGAVLES